MTLEAGKEMDRRCVMNWLNEVYVTPSRAFDKYTEDELKMFAHDALVLLKEQEAVKPRECQYPHGTYACGFCDYIPIGNKDGYRANYCPECGRAVKWDG